VGHLLGFLSVGKGIAKSPRIVKFFGRKYEWVVRQNFHFHFHFSLACLIELCLLGCGLKYLVFLTSFLSKFSRTVKTDDVTSGTRDMVKQEHLNASSGVKGLRSLCI